ncbi:MAG: Thiamine-phosphate synthase [Chroococcopsis gigantea SAG 12.99]|jgi:thiamine-phosphate pyrophosphorylase|nr:thiamine phosphate synthase [Chlorogloea purpurea SAG 13.99]MDV3000958.1 Thiamine-phosphate synthase [Chroococcopsis gigantea SAG 12.99]
MKSEDIAIKRILDANLDRAREGLRIIEEWCRFGLNDRVLANECKEMRQVIALSHRDELRVARDTPSDPGTMLTHPEEERRENLQALLRANLCRVQEALRVIEEYGKLYDPSMGTIFKELRYRVYTLESALLSQPLKSSLHDYGLYLVTSPDNNLLETVESALEGGLKLVQYRDKKGDDLSRFANARKLRHLCHQYGALLIINDRIDLAASVDADGIHLGQQDLPVATARAILGDNKIIGRSTTNPQEMAKALEEKADYIGVGPVYSTPTKPGKAETGLNYVSYAREHCPIPWFAIGGIDLDNLQAVIDAGARQVAVVRAIMQSDDPKSVTGQFLSRLSSTYV